jgi:hypothetical protein
MTVKMRVEREKMPLVRVNKDKRKMDRRIKQRQWKALLTRINKKRVAMSVYDHVDR